MTLSRFAGGGRPLTPCSPHTALNTFITLNLDFDRPTEEQVNRNSYLNMTNNKKQCGKNWSNAHNDSIHCRSDNWRLINSFDENDLTENPDRPNTECSSISLTTTPKSLSSPRSNDVQSMASPSFLNSIRSITPILKPGDQKRDIVQNSMCAYQPPTGCINTGYDNVRNNITGYDNVPRNVEKSWQHQCQCLEKCKEAQNGSISRDSSVYNAEGTYTSIIYLFTGSPSCMCGRKLRGGG